MEIKRVRMYLCNEIKDSKYATLVFESSKAGAQFIIQERLDCEETKYVMSTDGSVESIKINGVEAALSDDNNIDWAYEGNLYSIIGKDLSRAEVIKVAESIK